MDDRAYNVFTEFSRHVEDLCLHIRHQSFDNYVSHLISASLGAVEAAAAAQASALEGLEAGVGRVERGLVALGSTARRAGAVPLLRRAS